MMLKRTMTVLLMAWVCCGWAQGATTLTKGYQFFVDNGLQLQALGSANNWGGINTTNWNNSGYDVFFNSYHPLITGTLPWGFMVLDTATVDTLSSAQKGVLKFVQYKDELVVRDPAILTEMTAAVTAIKTKVPNAIVYGNLNCFDSYTVNEVKTYIQTVKPDMLNFTEYRFLDESTYHTQLYVDLALIRTAAQAGWDGTGAQPIPASMFLQRFNSPDQPASWRDHQPSESEMRLQQFAGWAFGFKSSIAFVYAAPYKESLGLINGAAFDEVTGYAPDTFPNAAFTQIAAINAESKNLSPVLSRLISTDVRMIMGKHGSNEANPLPAGGAAWSTGAHPYMTAISAVNNGTKNGGLPGDVIVGYYEPLLDSDKIGDSNADCYFMIVNGLTDANPADTAAHCRQTVHMVFDFTGTTMNSLLRQSRQTGEIEVVALTSLGANQYALDLALDGGTGDLFKFNNGNGLIVPWSGVELFQDNFNRVDDPNIGITSDGLVHWVEEPWSYNDCARLYGGTAAMYGLSGYGRFYPDYDLDNYSKYQISFDLWVDSGLTTTQPLFKVFSRRPVTSTSIWGTYDWQFSPNGVVDTQTGQRAIKVEFGLGSGYAVLADNAALTGVWNRVKINVDGSGTTITFGNLTSSIQATNGTYNDDVADYLNFVYYWSGDYGVTNFRIDNLRVSSMTDPVCGDTEHPYPIGDINRDCYVGLTDLASFAASWLQCSDPATPCGYNP